MRRPRDPNGASLALRLFVVGYFVWWFFPIVAGIRVAFAAGESPTIPQGFSLRWFAEVFGNDEARQPVLHSVWLATLTALIATSLGLVTAIGLHRWRSRWSRVSLGVFVFAVGVPQTVLATALFLAFLEMTPIRFGAATQLLAHITLALPFVVLVVSLSLHRLPRDVDESAVDLGASESSALLRVTLPQIVPAIVAAGTIAWLLSFDNIVLSRWLCLLSDCATIPVRIYGFGNPRATPLLFAYGSTMLAITALVALVTVPWLRWLMRARG